MSDTQRPSETARVPDAATLARLRALLRGATR
jgi:hypothetical protein